MSVCVRIYYARMCTVRERKRQEKWSCLNCLLETRQETCAALQDARLVLVAHFERIVFLLVRAAYHCILNPGESAEISITTGIGVPSIGA